MNMKTLYLLSSLLSISILGGCFGSGNEDAANGSFGLKIKVIEFPEEVPVSKLNNLIKVRLIDTDNKPAANFQVIFTYEGGTDLVIGNQVVTTDQNGFAETTFRAPSQIIADQIIKVRTSGLDIEESIKFDVISAGPPKPSSLVFNLSPADAVATLPGGDPIGTPFIIKVLDQYGNLYAYDPSDEDPAPTVSISLSMDNGNGSNLFLAGTLIKGTINSIVTFDEITYSRAETVKVKAILLSNSNQVSAKVSNPFPVVPGVPHYIAALAPGQSLNSGFDNAVASITGNPTSQKAGLKFTTQVVVLDEAFNVTTNASVPAFTPTFTPLSTANIVTQTGAPAGVATLELEPVVANANFKVNVAASYSGNPLAPISSGDIYVGPGVPNKISISQQPSTPTGAGLGFATPIKISILDKFNNLVTDANNRITIKAFTDACTTPIANSAKLLNTQVDAISGVATFTTLNYQVAEDIYLQGNLSTVLNPDSDCSNKVTINPGDAAALAWVAKPATNSQQVAGSALTTTPLVKVTDNFGNLVNNVATSVEVKVYSNACSTLISPTTPAPIGVASRTSPTDDTDAGIADFNALRVNLSGSNFYIRAEANGSLFTPCQGPLNFSPGNANSIIFSTDFTGSHQANLAFTPTPAVRVIDLWGNTKSAAGQSVVIVPHDSSAGTCTTPLTGKIYSGETLSAAAGTATASGFLYRSAGSVRFGAVLASDNNIKGCSSTPTTVGAGPLNKLVFTNNLPTPVKATETISSLGTVALQATDEWGNALNSAMAITLTAFTDPTCQTAALPTTAPNGSVALEGNQASSVSGVASFPALAFHRAQDVYFKAVPAVVLPGTPPCSSKVVINPGPVVAIKNLTQLPTSTVSADNNILPAPQFNFVDNYENIVKSTSYKMTLTSKGDFCAGSSTSSLNNAIDIAPNSTTGTATFASLSYRKAELFGIELSTDAPGISPVCLGNVTVVAGAAKKLDFVTNPLAGPIQAGLEFATVANPVTVGITDNWNNLVNNVTKSIKVAVFQDANCSAGQEGVGTLQGDFENNSSGGAASFNDLSYTKARAALYLKANVPLDGTITPDCSAAFEIKHNVPTQIRLATSSSISSSLFVNATHPSFQLELIDTYQNTVNTDGPYTLDFAVMQNNCTTEHFAGTTTPAGGHDKLIVNPITSSTGFFSVNNLQYRVTGSAKLKFWLNGSINSTDLGAYCSSSIAIKSSIPDSVAWTGYPVPSPNDADSTFSVQPVVRINDTFGNQLTESSTVNLTAHTAGNCAAPIATGVISGTQAIAANGSASFVNLAYRKAEAVHLKASVIDSGNTTYSSLTGNCNNAITVSAGAIDHVDFLTQPDANGTAGVVLAQQPSVEILDQWENLVDTNAENINYSLHDNSANCTANTKTLTPNNSNAIDLTPITSSNGVGTATDLTVNYAGANLYLRAELNSDDTMFKCSQKINVKAATPTSMDLATYTYPATLKADVNFPNVQVSLFDTFGNLASGTSHQIIADFYSDASTCLTTANDIYQRGTLTKSTSTGSAIFNGLGYNLSGVNIAIGAYLNSNNSVKTCFTQSVPIVAGDTAKIAFVQQPSGGAEAGVNLFSQPSIKITDLYGNDTLASATVNIVPVKNTNSTCTTGTPLLSNRYDYTDKGTTQTSSGSLAYEALKINETGVYRLKASSSSLLTLQTACTSVDVTITPSSITEIQVLSAIPSTKRADQNFNIDAEAVDGLGNLITGAAGTGPVRIAYYLSGTNCVTQAPPNIPNGAISSYSPSDSFPTAAINGVIDINNFMYRTSGDYQFKLIGLNVESACLPLLVNSGKTTVQAADPATIEWPSLGVGKKATETWTTLNFTLKDTYGNSANSQPYNLTFEVYDSSCTTLQDVGTQSKFAYSPEPFTISNGAGSLGTLQMQKTGDWTIKATVAGYGASQCSSPFNIEAGPPVKLLWASHPSNGVGGTLKAGQTLESLPAETMPAIYVADIYDNQSSDPAVGNKVITLNAYTDAICSQLVTITNQNQAGSTQNALQYAFGTVDSDGDAVASSLTMLKSHPTKFFFKADNTTYDPTPCSQDGILVGANSLDFLRVRTLDTNLGSIVSNNAQYFNVDPTFWSTGYDLYGNFISNIESNWSLFHNATINPAPAILSVANQNKNAYINSSVAGAAGVWKLEVAATSNPAIYITLQPLSLTLQTPSKFLVSVSSALPAVAGAALNLQITAVDASDSPITNFQGIKNLSFVHNQTKSLVTGCGTGGGSNNNFNADVTFSNGVGNYVWSPGPKEARVGTTVTATLTSPALTGTTVAFNVNSAAAQCNNIMRTNNVVFTPIGENDLNRVFTLKYASTDAYGNHVTDVSGLWSTTGHLEGLLPGDPIVNKTQVTFTSIRMGSGTLNVTDGSSPAAASITTNSGGDFAIAASDTSYFAHDSIKVVDHYDILEDSLGTAWRFNAAPSKSWHTELSSIVRGAKKEFPIKTILVGNDFSLDIIDASNNSPWMRFLSSNDAAIDSTRGNISAAKVKDGKVFIGTKNPSEDRGSLTIADFKRDKVYRIRSHPTNGSDSKVMQGGIELRNGSPIWNAGTIAVPAQLVIYAMAHQKVSGSEYLALGTKTGLIVYKIVDQYAPPTDVFTVEYAKHSLPSNPVKAVDISSDGKIYYTVEDTGVFKQDATTITFTAGNTGSFTGTQVYGSASQRATLTHLKYNSIDVLEDSSLNAGYNMIALGSNNGVIQIHEGSSNTVAQSHNLTYVGQGSSFFNNIAEFDGVNDFISIPNKPGSPSGSAFPQQSGSIEFSFRNDVQIDASTSRDMTLFYRGAGGFNNFASPGNISVRFVNRRLLFTYGTSDAGTLAEARTNRDQWLKGNRYHVRVAWKWNTSSEIQVGIWVNGTRDVDNSYKPDVFTGRDQSLVAANNSGIVLGANITGSSKADFFLGAMDELIIRNEVPNNDFDSGFLQSTVEYDGSTSDVVALYHFNKSWDTTTSAYNVAKDSATLTPANGTYTNGASSSYPILVGLSRTVTQVKGNPDPSAPKLVVLTQFTGGSLTELNNIQSSSGTANIATSRNHESLAIDVFHRESATDYDMVYIERESNLRLIRR